MPKSAPSGSIYILATQVATPRLHGHHQAKLLARRANPAERFNPRPNPVQHQQFLAPYMSKVNGQVGDAIIALLSTKQMETSYQKEKSKWKQGPS